MTPTLDLDRREDPSAPHACEDDAADRPPVPARWRIVTTTRTRVVPSAVLDQLGSAAGSSE